MTNFSDLNNRLNKLTNFAKTNSDKPFGDNDKKIIDLIIKTRPQNAYNFIISYHEINPNIGEKAENYYLSKVSIDDIIQINRIASPYHDNKIELDDKQIAKLIIGNYKEKLTKENKTVTKVKNGGIFPGNVAERLAEIDSYIWGLNGWESGRDVDYDVLENIAKMVIPKVIDPKCITDIDAEFLEAGNHHEMLEVVGDNYNAIPHYYRERRYPYGKGRFDDDDNPYTSRNTYEDDDDDDDPYGW